MLAACCGIAHAQSDTTRPALTLNAADGGSTFTSLPAPLTGSVTDAGGMGRVEVALVRNHTSSTQSWSGTSWVAGTVRLNTTLGAATNGTRSWSASGPWPSGANLARGAYTWRVTAWDAAGNRSDIARAVVIGAPDDDAPAMSILAPANETLLDSTDPVGIHGTVSDGGGSGVAYVQVFLKHSWDGLDSQAIRYWDGQKWGGYFVFEATLGAPAADGTRTWSAAGAWPPPAQLATGRYKVAVFAFDKNGNRATANSDFGITPRDDTAPALSIEVPAAGQQLYALPEIRGAASDEGSGLARLDVYLQRTLTGADGAPTTQFWDGGAWSASFSYYGMLLPRTEFGWSRNSNLPVGAQLGAGEYEISARAFDRYDNSTIITRGFSIVPIPPLSIDAHLRADASQSWLGEGFANGNGYAQTLSGTIRAGETQTRQMRIVRSGGVGSKTVRVTLPDWAAFVASGWTARFTDVDSGTDITGQITSAQGWNIVMNSGDARRFDVEVTAPADAAIGHKALLKMLAEADPTSETPARDMIRANWLVVAPLADLSIRAGTGAEGAWLGEEVRNPSGFGQTLEQTVGSSHVVRGQLKLSVRDAANGQMMRWSVPDWTAFVAGGWSARFWDGATGGDEITGQISGQGWTSAHYDEQQTLIRYEITVPASASDITRVLSVRAQADSGGVADVVKASVRVPANVQPDVAVSALDASGAPGEWTGVGELSPTPQSLAGVWGAGETRKFALRVTNQSSAAASFQLEPPTVPAGWELKLHDALEVGNELAIGDDGLTTPALAPGASLAWRAELKAGADATDAANLKLRFSGGSSFDEVEIEAILQKLAKLQWSSDGQNWTDVTPQTMPQIEQHATVGVRGVKSVPDAPWPTAQPIGPKWQWGGLRAVGDSVWVKGRELGGTNDDQVSASLGSQSKEFVLSVKPVVEVSLAVSQSDLLAHDGPQSLNSTAVTVSLATPVAALGGNAKVRLQAINEYGQNSGKWNGASAPHIDVTVGIGGSASASWSSGNEGGQIEFTATVLNEDGTPRDLSDTAFIQTHKPYTQIKAGNWQENNGIWSRTITASTWFLGQKLGGIGVALSSQVKDYETQQPAPGWANTAPFDAATGTTGADGKFSTVQRWNPVEAGAWPHDFEVEAEAQLQ